MIKLTLFLHLPSNRLQIAAVVSYNAHQIFLLPPPPYQKAKRPWGRDDEVHARAGGSIDTLCMCPLRAETPLYLCSTALQYSPRLFPLLLLRLEKHFSDLPVIMQTNVSLMSVKKSSRFTESPPPHPPLTNFVAFYC